jgi:hypothetical protein
MYDLIKPSLSLICASVIPICRNSAKTPCISGSVRSIEDGISCTGAGARTGGGGGCTGAATGGSVAGIVGVAADELLPRRPLKSERPDFPLDIGTGPCPRVEPNGVAFVSLLAFFSRSCTFFKKVFASFSSANDKAAGHSSSSNV